MAKIGPRFPHRAMVAIACRRLRAISPLLSLLCGELKCRRTPLTFGWAALDVRQQTTCEFFAAWLSPCCVKRSCHASLPHAARDLSRDCAVVRYRPIGMLERDG